MYQSLHDCILELLADESSISVEDVAQRLQNRRLTSVAKAINALLMQGQVQRVRTSNRFRLSPTQASIGSGARLTPSNAIGMNAC